MSILQRVARRSQLRRLVRKERFLRVSGLSSSFSTFAAATSQCKFGAPRPNKRTELHRQSRRHFSDNKRDHYEVLGLGRDATDAQLKKSYFRLAKKYHPDTNKSEEAKGKFQEISHAYDILSDSEKRKAYDLHGHAADEMGMGQQPFGGQGGPDFADFAMNMSADDLFSHIFGTHARSQHSTGGSFPGNDIQTGLRISFMEAVQGCKHNISVQRMAACSPCKGSGVKAGSTPAKCRPCEGTGVRNQVHGMMYIQAACNACGGTGTSVDPCGPCSGTGTKRETKTISVTIPQGVDSGTRVRLSNQGDAGRNGGPRGDLFLQIQVDNHPQFDRQGSDVHLRLDISFVDAILGTKVEIPTLTNPVKLTVKPGTQPGETVRIRGKGVKRLNRPDYGDQFIHFNVELPKHATSEQKKLLEKFRKVDPAYIDATDEEKASTAYAGSESDDESSKSGSSSPSARRRKRKQVEKKSKKSASSSSCFSSSAKKSDASGEDEKPSDGKKKGIFSSIFGSNASSS